MTTCATPWRHQHNPADQREADLAVSINGGEPVELCLDCACDVSRQAIAQTRRAQVLGDLGAAATVQVGPVRA